MPIPFTVNILGGSDSSVSEADNVEESAIPVINDHKSKNDEISREEKSINLISQTCDRMMYSTSIKETAVKYFKDSIGMEDVKINKTFAVGCIITACLMNKTKCDEKELRLRTTFNFKRRRAYDYALKVLQNQQKMKILENTASGNLTADMFKNLYLGHEIHLVTSQIIRKILELKIAMRSDAMVAVSAVLYMAAQAFGDRISFKDIAYRAKKFDSDVHEAYYIMYQTIDQLFPSDFEFHLPIGQIALPVGTGIPRSLYFSILTMSILTFPESGLLIYVFPSFPSESSSRPVLICERIQNLSDTQLVKPRSFVFEILPAKLYFVKTMILPNLNVVENPIVTVYSLQKISSLKFEGNFLTFRCLI